MAQDNDNSQTIRAQLWKACATWAWVGKVLWGENTSPTVAAKFYLAVVQAILLYGSKMWVISPQAMARLEGFHIKATWRMAQRHKPATRPSKGVGLPEIRGRFAGVWDEDNSGVHSDPPADDRSVRCNQTYPTGMQTGQATEGGGPTPVVVGTAYGFGRPGRVVI